MDRSEALDLVRQHVKNEKLIKHMLAVEAVMRNLAKRLGGDEEIWGLAGLIHDIDYDETLKRPELHGKIGAGYVREAGLTEEIARAVESHAGHIPRLTPLEKALYATDPLTGLIVAAALMHPSRKLAEVDVNFVLNRFKEKRFAQGANREQIKSCEELGLSLREFIEIALDAMKSISGELGL